jgi:hypothetical protein
MTKLSYTFNCFYFLLNCSTLSYQPLLYIYFLQEVMSYIKGSAEAVASSSGVLSEEEYLAMGRKRAAGNLELRRQVYAMLPVRRLQAIAVPVE